MNRCPITYQEIGPGKRYSEGGLKKLSPRLRELCDLPYSAEEQRQEAVTRAPKMSIQGVQPKLSARLDVASERLDSERRALHDWDFSSAVGSNPRQELSLSSDAGSLQRLACNPEECARRVRSLTICSFSPIGFNALGLERNVTLHNKSPSLHISNLAQYLSIEKEFSDLIPVSSAPDTPLQFNSRLQLLTHLIHLR